MPVVIDQATGRTTLFDELPVLVAPPEEDLPTITVRARFDWPFWIGLGALGFLAIYMLQQSQGRPRN